IQQCLLSGVKRTLRIYEQRQKLPPLSVLEFYDFAVITTGLAALTFASRCVHIWVFLRSHFLFNVAYSYLNYCLPRTASVTGRELHENASHRRSVCNLAWL